MICGCILWMICGCVLWTLGPRIVSMICGHAEDILRYCADCVWGAWIICIGWAICGCCWITKLAVCWIGLQFDEQI